jgi:hypothetical protein
MIGHGFESRIDLLAQIIRDKHDASLTKAGVMTKAGVRSPFRGARSGNNDLF